MLIGAGTKERHNMMTASWGGLGVLWNRKVCFCFIRPQRFTFQLVEEFDTFSLTFFGPEHKKALNYCGTKSGRDHDKAKETGLTPIEITPGTISFAEARMVLECKKIAFGEVDPTHFIDPAIEANYPQRDYHRVYVGEIANVWIKKS
jgi:flavin reductase (DIM6/NTAB) family NADH-FMN oxidoreductase RutF